MEVSQEIESRNAGLPKSTSGFSTMRKTMLQPVNTPTHTNTSPSPQTASAVLAHITNAVISLHTHYEQVDAAMYKQTRVTWTQRIELGGSIPRQIVTVGTPKLLMHLSRMRQQFDKSLEIDGATRARNVGLIADNMEQYSEEENALLDEGEKHFTDFKEMKAESLKMASPLKSGEIAFKKKDSRQSCVWALDHACKGEPGGGARVPVGHNEALGATRGRPGEERRGAGQRA